MNTKQMIEEEAAKLTVKMLKILNAGVPFKTMHPQKDKVQQLIEGSLTKHEAAVLSNVPVGFVRQWINEDVKKDSYPLVSNDDIQKFIDIAVPTADHLRASKSERDITR